MSNAINIEFFRKSTEDLVQANVREIFKVKYGEQELIKGDNTVRLSDGGDSDYTDAGEYEIKIFEAVDKDGIDIKDALSIASRTASLFVIVSPRSGRLRWTTSLKTPNFQFWT